MLTEKQINYLGYLISTIAYNELNDDILEWYDDQPENNVIYSQDANYRDQIILDRIKNADYYLVSGLIGDLKKIIYEEEEFDDNQIEEIINKLNQL